MRTKLIFILLYTCIITYKVNAQNNKEEAILNYQLGQEEYDKQQYAKAISYLDKAEQLNPDAKIKTCYLKTKCYENLLFKPNTDGETYISCLKSIDYFLNIGKDEDKKMDLRKLKIKIEDNEDYQLYASVESMTLQEAYDYIKNVAFGSTKYLSNNCSGIFHSADNNKIQWIYNLVDNCKIEFIIVENLSETDMEIIEIYEIDFSLCKINNEANVNYYDKLDFTSGSKEYDDFYMNGKEKHFTSDLENFHKGINKTHTRKGHFEFNGEKHFKMTNFCENKQGNTKKDKLMLHKAFEKVIKSCQK